MLALGGFVEMTIDPKSKVRGPLFLLLAWGIILSTATMLSAQNSPATAGSASASGSTTVNAPDSQSAAPARQPQPNNDQITRRDVVDMDRFLDDHPEVAEQLRKDPSLIDNRQWVAAHPALQDYLKEHPQVAEEFRSNPNQFMHDEDRLGQDDITRKDLADMNRFLDKHPEIAEQLRKDPSLIDNHKWVAAHPALQDYLRDHPEVAEAFRANPNAFMRDEDRYDHQEADNRNGFNDRDRDMNRDRFNDHQRGELTNFGQFLGDHSSVASDLQRDPSLANNQEYRSSHPELNEYLNAHPEVNQQLAQNPQAVMTSNWVQQNGSASNPSAKPDMTKPKTNPNQ
jgi:hypothetical protein